MNYGAQAGLEYGALPGHPSPRSNAFITVNKNVALYEPKITLTLPAEINFYNCVPCLLVIKFVFAVNHY